MYLLGSHTESDRRTEYPLLIQRTGYLTNKLILQQVTMINSVKNTKSTLEVVFRGEMKL